MPHVEILLQDSSTRHKSESLNIIEHVYIHYGSNNFETPRPIHNRPYFTKPYGGFWASRVGDPCGWADWCEQEDYRTEQLDSHFKFILSDNARILELNHPDQLTKLPHFYDFNPMKSYDACYLDFEQLKETYDAIEVTDIHKLYFPLYGWDVNSILIMNPDIVRVIPEERSE